jgi:amidohydrolase
MKMKENVFKELVANRRKIHSLPELQYKEYETSKLVEQHLRSLGLQFESKVAGTGVVCLLDSGKPGKTILVRADMDALPIYEENKVDYCSQVEGVMHACGHDGHTAVLMSIAKELSSNQENWVPRGRVLLVFQPAEEGGCGADKMVEEGILEKYAVDAAFALHVWNHIDTGKVGVVDGTIMAAVDEFFVTVKGVSGHGAMPQHTVDPIVVTAHIITALQTIVSRDTDPLDSCVVTVGSIHGGDAFNVIPEEVKLRGTVRTYSKKLYEKIEQKFTNLVEGIANSFGAGAIVTYHKVDKPTINDPKMANIVRKAAKEVLGENSVTEEEVRTMGGEDFSAFLMRVPGCYFFVGSRNEEKGFVHPHHSSKFDFDEDCLMNGYQVMLNVIRTYLQEP